MTARLASLPAPKGLTPARSGAAERSPADGMTTRLASLPAPKGPTPASTWARRARPSPTP